jgi:hypothetical protein
MHGMGSHGQDSIFLGLEFGRWGGMLNHDGVTVQQGGIYLFYLV